MTIDRPHRRNAVDAATARQLYEAFVAFDGDPRADIAILTGAGGTFCAGADLISIAGGRPNEVTAPARMAGTLGPMGPTRLELGKPVIAAVEGFAVAGGLELAIWCDLRVASSDAVFGVFSRRFGVPLIDGGTVRLPRLIGHGRALEMILTGRPVEAAEAVEMGLATQLAEPGRALAAALELAEQLTGFPQRCLRADLASARLQWDLPLDAALYRETAGGRAVLDSGESRAGASSFAGGAGRHGAR